MNCVKSTMKNSMASKIFHWSTIHTSLPAAREWFLNANVFKKVLNRLSLHKKERIDRIFFDVSIDVGDKVRLTTFLCHQHYG